MSSRSRPTKLVNWTGRLLGMANREYSLSVAEIAQAMRRDSRARWSATSSAVAPDSSPERHERPPRRAGARRRRTGAPRAPAFVGAVATPSLLVPMRRSVFGADDQRVLLC